ncbi:MAG TPA: MBL fold metallo-hydrolase [Vicinamibacterales bacterium]
MSGFPLDRRHFLLQSLAAGASLRAGAALATVPSPRASRLILLGTAGGATPKKTRSAPAQVVVVGDRGYVVDCGNGVARQMMLADVFGTLRHVFITHHHSDHNADYGNLLLLAWATDLSTRVDAWGPPPLARMTDLFFEMNAVDLEVREKDEGRPPLRPLVHVHEVARAGTVMKDDRVTVTCAVVQHPMIPLAFAYRFDCPDRAIVFSGDTRPTDSLIALARGADVLVHEALWLPAAPGAPGSALRRHILDSHTSVEDAGRIAAAAGVQTLVLSHLVPADTPHISDDQWLAGARTHFDGRIIVGRDLLEI